MDGLRWSRVLLQWVKDSRLVNCECSNIEQCNVQEFYDQFRTRMEPTLTIKEAGVVEFLQAHFPHYELYLTESGQIAAPDHYYIFSLLLYFSCVRHPERFFQQICNGFDKPQQYAVTAFLKSMLEGNHLRKEIDRMMIRKAIEDSMPKAMMPPASPCPGTVGQQQSKPAEQSTQSFPSATRLTTTTSSSSGPDVTDSPLRLGTRPLRLSPPTPKTLILDERTRQLKELKAQLEAERYEKGYLEVQLKQLQDKNEKFLEDKRKHLKEIRELRTELQQCNRENESPNKRRVEDNKVARVERQLAEKEEALDRLRIELETVGENNRNATEMINYRNNQILVLKDKILELETSIVSLSECLEKRDEMIKYLRENCEDLQNFIDENRLQGGEGGGRTADFLNTSCDLLELSSVGSGGGGGGGGGAASGGSMISPENLALAVVDVQLKEKEAENGLLKRSLEMIEQEKVRVSALVGQFFRLYGDVVGRLPVEGGQHEQLGFVEKMQCFKACYETLFEEHGKFREGKVILEEKNEALEEDVRQLRGELMAVTEVLRKLESHSAEIEKELAVVRMSAGEYQRLNIAQEEKLVKQKRDYLKLIAEKDAISEENLTLKVEHNSLKGDYDTITQKIDYLMVSLNEDYEGSDFSSWFDKMEDLRVRLATLKDEKERLETMNMKIVMEKVALEKEISNGEVSRTKLEERNSASEAKIAELAQKLGDVQKTLTEREDSIGSLEKLKADLEETSQSLSAELVEAQKSLKTALGKLKISEDSSEDLQIQLQQREQELAAANEVNCEANSKLEEQLNSIQQLRESLERNSEQNENLAEQINKLEDNLRSKSNELEELNTKISNLTQEHQQTLQQHIQAEQEKQQLEQQLIEAREASTKSAQHIDALESQLDNLQKLLHSQTQQSEQLNQSHQNQLEEARTKQQLMSSCNDALLAGMTVLQDRIAALDRRYKSKNVGLTAKLDQIADLLKKLSSVQCKLRLEKASLEENLEKLKVELQEARETNEKLTGSEKTLLEVVEQLRNEKTSFEEELASMTDRLKLETKMVEKLKDDFEAMEIDKTRKEETLKEQLDSAVKLTKQLREEITTQELELKEKNEQLRCLSDERDELEVKSTKLEVDLKETATNLEVQKQMTSKTSQANIAVEQQLEQIRSELTQIETERSRVEQELTETRAELDTQTETVSRLCSDKEQLEEKIQELAEALSVTRQSKSTYQESYEREQEKSEELSCQLASVTEKLNAVAQEVTRLTDEQEELLATQETLLSLKEKLVEQVDELTESVAELEEDRDTLREEKCRLEAECERVDADREALGEQCGKLLGELARVKEETAGEAKKQEECIKELETARGELMSKVELLKEEQTVIGEKVRQLEETNKTLEGTLSEKGDVESRIVELAKSVEQLQAEKSALEADKATLSKELKDAQVMVEQMKKELSELETVKTTLQGEVESLQTCNESLTRKLEHVSEEFETSSKNVKTLEANVAELSEQIIAKDAAIEDIRTNLLMVEESMQAKVTELTAVSEHLLLKTKELETVQSEKEQETVQQTASMTTVQKEHQETRQQLKAVQEEKVTLQREVEQLSEELERRTKEVHAAETAIKSKDKEICSTVEALAAAEAKSAELAQQLETITANKSSLESQLEVLQNDLDSKQQDLEQFSSKLNETEESKQELDKQLQQLNATQSALKAEVQQLNEQLIQQKEQNVNQQATVTAKDHEISQLSAGLEKIKAFQQQLEEKVAEFEQVVSEKDEVEAQLVKAQNELETLNAEKGKLAEELAKVSEEKSDVDRRLIQQLQDYDTLNEGFLIERDNKETMVQQMKALFDEKQSIKAQLTSKEKQLEKLRREMDELCGKNKQVDSLSQEMSKLKEEKNELVAKKEELHEMVETKEIQEKALQESMEHLRESLKSKQQEIDTMHSDMTSLKESLHNMKIENSKLKSTQELQQTKMLNLELKNSEQSKKIEQLEASLSKTESSHLEDNTKATTLLKELEKYKAYEERLEMLEELHRKEKEINAQCLHDNDILSAKLKRNRKQTEEKEQQWLHEKQKLLEKMNDTGKTAEEKVKETRIEFEGKLEKMKEKMKSLYNLEMEKTRVKHEKDFLALKEDLQQESKKFEKLQQQATKLQQQLGNVNEKNLELMKENEFMKSKLRIMEEIRDERKSMLPPPAHARLCSNLKMEDEEGEIFNNTYLTDLKTGRMSPPFGGRESVRYSELQQRNSMLPPHLKSSYLPQYTDGDLTDDDRDTASVNLDDSSTSLISRKKQGGTTSYKRPGPPTPSKKAGRLSFGGSLPTNDFQYKEISKDGSSGSSGVGAVATLTSRLSFGGGRKSNVDSSTVLPGASSGTLAELNARRKTPGKFKQMFSSSNLLNQLPASKDETPTTPKFATHPAIHKITCIDDTDSGSSGPEDLRRERSRAKRRQESISLRTSSRTVKVPHVRKMIARFDKNRRLSSVDSDTDAPPTTPDPYDGFTGYDQIARIDINSMDVFERKEPKPKVIVFSGEIRDGNNNNRSTEHHEPNDEFGKSDFVQRLCTVRRDKQRRKSRDQRRESFNRLRNIDGDAIASRRSEDQATNDTNQLQFESLLLDITLDRPSEILPQSRRKFTADQFENVVTSSTGMPAMTGIPLLERFSEIFRIATLQRDKMAKSPSKMVADAVDQVSEGKLVNDRAYFVLLIFAGLSFSSLVFSIYMHYTGFRVPKE